MSNAKKKTSAAYVTCPDCAGERLYESGAQCKTCDGDGVVGYEDAARFVIAGDDKDARAHAFTEWLATFLRMNMEPARYAIAETFWDGYAELEFTQMMDDANKKLAEFVAKQKRLKEVTRVNV